MTYSELTTEGAVATITMTQGGRLNALSSEMLDSLQAHFDALASSDAKVIVLRGEGKAFCAGHDLKQMQSYRQAADGGSAAFKALFDQCAKLMLTIRAQPQPVIARVHGIATAAGCQLAATCDMVVAADTARFGVNGINIGLFCSTPMVALTRAVPRKKAFEMLTTGRFLTAREAEDAGLVTRLCHADQLDDVVDDLAGTLAAKLGPALKMGKQAFYDQAELSTADAYGYAGDVMVANTLMDDTNEGIAAFLEKRAPSWGT